MARLQRILEPRQCSDNARWVSNRAVPRDSRRSMPGRRCPLSGSLSRPWYAAADYPISLMPEQCSEATSVIRQCPRLSHQRGRARACVELDRNYIQQHSKIAKPTEPHLLKSMACCKSMPTLTMVSAVHLPFGSNSLQWLYAGEFSQSFAGTVLLITCTVRQTLVQGWI